MLQGLQFFSIGAIAIRGNATVGYEKLLRVYFGHVNFRAWSTAFSLAHVSRFCYKLRVPSNLDPSRLRMESVQMGGRGGG